MNTLRQLRNFWIPGVATIVLACSSDAVAQTSYKVTDLGTLNGDNFSCAMAVNKHGWTEIQDGVEDPVSNSLFANLVAGHAVLNIGELKIDLTLGGANSWMGYGGLNDRGEAVGFAETSVPDPDGEDVCAFGTKRTCSPFLWRNGHMSALPTVGGNNGQAFAINNRGQITGMATVLSGPHAGEIHAFLATPVDERIDKSIADVATTQPKLPANVGKELLQRFGRGRFDQ
jgi:uncharacterized membrane protein